MAIHTITKEEFSKKIEKYVQENNSSYMETVLMYLEEYSFDFSIAPKLLSQPILEKVENEARELNFLPKIKNKLPFSWHLYLFDYNTQVGSSHRYLSPGEIPGESRKYGF